MLSKKQSVTLLNRLNPFASLPEDAVAEAEHKAATQRNPVDHKKSSKKKKKTVEVIKKEKRRKEKEKARIAAERAIEKLNAEKIARNEEPLLLVETTETDNSKHKRHDSTLSTDPSRRCSTLAPTDAMTLSEQHRLDQLKLNELHALDEAEATRRRKRQQAQHNLLLNAQRMGGKVKAYDREKEEKKWLAKKRAQRQAGTQISITEPMPIIKRLLDAVCSSQQSLKNLMKSESVIDEVNASDLRALKASLECYLNRFASPLNFKCEVLWRFAVTAADPQYLPLSMTWIKLAHYAFNLLLEKADASIHLFQWHALMNSLGQCETLIDEYDMKRLMEKSNKEHQFTPPVFTERFGDTAVFQFRKSTIVAQ